MEDPNKESKILGVRSDFLYEELLLRSASGVEAGDGDWYGSRFLLVVVELRRTIGRELEAEDSCTEALLWSCLSSLSLRCLLLPSPSRHWPIIT